MIPKNEGVLSMRTLPCRLRLDVARDGFFIVQFLAESKLDSSFSSV